MKRVVIVPGHSFKDPGATNKKIGVTEYDYCLSIATELFKEEKWDDIDIVLKSRNKDYSSLPREINSLNPDLVIELHLNAANGVAQGTEVLYCANSKKGKAIAEIVQENLIDKLKLNDRGIKARNKNDRGGHILCNTIAPCLIVEPFFLDTIKSKDDLMEDEVLCALKASIREIIDILF